MVGKLAAVTSRIPASSGSLSKNERCSMISRTRITSILFALLFAVPLMLPPRRAEAATSLPIKIESVVVSNGRLVAIGSLGTQTFAAPLTLTAKRVAALNLTAKRATAAQGTPCPILNLALGPINLDLLGLFVQTSPICLSITAVPGAGNLLGNLLCSVANLLNGGLSVQQVLATLNGPRRTTFLNGLTTLLQGAFSAIGAATPTAQQVASCPILNLTLGPLDLNLLGLLVHLDDCAGGPVIVTISAIPSTEVGGGLLGDLLCSLANLLNNPPAILSTLTTAINGL